MQRMVSLLQILLLAQHFRAPLRPSSGAQEYYTGGCCLWYFVLWFSSFRSGAELWVLCPVCRMLHCRSYCCSTCFGHHYAHHQELKSIIQWLLPVVFGALVFKLFVWCGAVSCWSGLRDAAPSRRPDQQLENHSTKYHRQQLL